MQAYWKRAFKYHPYLTWESGRDFVFILAGALLQALSMRLFLIPAQLTSGGISVLSQIINCYTGLPIGVMVLLGRHYLGGPRFALRTAFAVVSFSIFVDLLTPFLPLNELTDDTVLNTRYGVVVGGIGFGLVYRGRRTSGGSDSITNREFQSRRVSYLQMP